MALSIGSSWTTAGTIGVGLVGIAAMLGVSPAITAGAVVSGAYLGDKLSPLSETTILTAQMVKADVMTHISAQAWTSVPAFGLAMVFFTILQPGVYAAFVGQEAVGILDAVRSVWQALATGFETTTDLADIDRLLSRGGMDSMLLTLWLIIGAVTFGALMDELGLISRITEPMIARAKSRGALFLTVFASAFGLNIVAGDQYIALVLPARTYRAEFARRSLAPTNLSRLCADSGTVTSALVPWNSCGAFMGSTLGVATVLYLPFAFFNIFSPLLSVLYGFTGFKIVHTEPEPLESGS